MSYRRIEVRQDKFYELRRVGIQGDPTKWEGCMTRRTSAVMWEMGIAHPPHLHEPACRFWFTEHGWSRMGAATVKALREEGLVDDTDFRVVVARSYDANQVVYQDKDQVAMIGPVVRYFPSVSLEVES